MPIGLDEAAGVAGIISVCVTLFQGCVKGMILIADAQHMGRSVERLNLMLEWEQFRFLRWGEKAGLCDGVPDSRLNWNLAYELLGQLDEDISDAQRLRDRYSLDTVSDDSSSPPRDATTVTQIVTPDVSRRSGRLAGRSWAFLSSSVRKARSQAVQEKTGAFKKLRWLEIDEDKIRRLLSDISYFNNALQDLLDNSHQRLMKTGMEALLRDLISRCSEAADLETIKAFLQEETVANVQAVDGASKVKEIRVLLGVDKRAQESSNSKLERPKLTRIKYENLSNILSVDEDHKWEAGDYKISSSSKSSKRKNVHSYVLIEWKRSNQRTDSKVKRRVMELALLMSVSSETTFHSLKCLGYLEKTISNQENMYAYVFEMANLLGDDEEANHQTDVTRPSMSTGVTSAVKMTPLSLKRALSLPHRPSLSERLSMSLSIAESVLQMHTAGWLHKNIGCNNIIFVSPSVDGWQTGKVSGPFVAGYEYARNSFEETETMPFDEQQFLYRHPAVGGEMSDGSDPSRRRQFSKRYDLHSLGCVLLEIATWRPFEDILLSTNGVGADISPSVAHSSTPQPPEQPKQTPQSCATDLTSSTSKSASQLTHERRVLLTQLKRVLESPDTAAPILDLVGFAGGNRLREAVSLCFFPVLEKRDGDDEEEEGEEKEEFADTEEYLESHEKKPELEFSELSVTTQLSIVNILRSLCENV